MNAQEIRADRNEAIEKLIATMPKGGDTETWMAGMMQAAFQAAAGLLVESSEIAAQLAEGQLSLRDRIAIAAMQGDFAAQSEHTGFVPFDNPHRLLQAARNYYEMADAMLYVRDHRKQEAPPQP